MPKFKNRIGQRYGRLLVMRYIGRDYRKKHLWECKCDCGNTKIVVADNLSSGKSKSCGCLKKEMLQRQGNQYGLYIDREIAICKVQYSHLRRRHTRYSGEILPLSDFISKIKSPCFYCGVEFSKVIQDRKNESKKFGLHSDTLVHCNGIDRIDNSLGYTSSNTVACCTKCNTAKNTMSISEFYAWLLKTSEHFIYQESKQLSHEN